MIETKLATDELMELAPLCVRDLWNEWLSGRIDAMTLENRANDLVSADPANRRFFEMLRQWDSASVLPYNVRH